jgi:hypothetical protein
VIVQCAAGIVKIESSCSVKSVIGDRASVIGEIMQR